MIPQDDPLLKLLKEIGADEGLYIIGINLYDDETGEAILVLKRFGFVAVELTGDDPYEWLATLNDSGRAWLEAAENDRRFRVLEGRVLRPLFDSVELTLDAYHVSERKTDQTVLSDAADAAIKAGWE